MSNSKANSILKFGLGALLLGQAVLFYTKTPEVTGFFEVFRFAGKFILPLAFLVLIFPTKRVKSLEFIFLLSATILYVDSLFAFTQNKYAIEQIIEHSLKIGLPILYYFRNQISKEGMIFGLKILVAFTFIGHGMFALGIHFVPGGFIQMVQNVFGFSVDNSLLFLQVIGVLDLLFACLIFIPKIEKIALQYIIIWGLLTSVARVVGYYSFVPMEEFLGVYVFEMIWRTPHFAVGISLLLLNSIQFKAFKFYVFDSEKAYSSE